MSFFIWNGSGKRYQIPYSQNHRLYHNFYISVKLVTRLKILLKRRSRSSYLLKKNDHHCFFISTRFFFFLLFFFYLLPQWLRSSRRFWLALSTRSAGRKSPPPRISFGPWYWLEGRQRCREWPRYDNAFAVLTFGGSVKASVGTLCLGRKRLFHPKFLS